MSDQATEQTVVEEPVAASVTAATDQSARNDDDLSTLLDQYDEGTKSPQTRPDPKADAGTSTDVSRELSELRNQVQELSTKGQREAIEKDIDALAGKVKGDLKLPDRVVKGWLDAMARENPKLADAYFRPKSAADKERLVASLTKQFHKDISVKSVDEGATEDRAAVAAAVRGSSTKAPADKAPNYAGLKDGELQQEWDKYL